MKREIINTQSKMSDFFGTTANEKKKIATENIIHNLLVYIHFGLAFAGYLPMWTFCIGVLIYIPRWMIALHESQHFFTPQTINPITRHNLLILTPFQLGYREMRDIHMRHHAYTATEKDPEYYHIKGSPVAGFINVMFSPEQSVYFWIRDKGIDAQLISGMFIRLSLFVAIVVGFGWASLWYFIPVRIAYGACLYFFSYFLHRKNSEFGTFKRNYPNGLVKLVKFLYGETLLQSVTHHDIHHDYPAVSGAKLGLSRPFYQPKTDRT